MKLEKTKSWRIKQKIGLVILLLVFPIVLFVDNIDRIFPLRSEKVFPRSVELKLSEEEMKIASIAWKYFENNYQPATGMVNAVQGYPSTTLWDTASYLGGLVAAHQLGIIDTHKFNTRLLKITETFLYLKLVDDQVFNKAYNTQTMQMVNYANQPGAIGYSPIDIGRLLIWFKIIKSLYPHFATNIDNIVLRLNFCPLIDKCGNLHGTVIDQTGKMIPTQEGRLGYEEYAANGFALWGFSTKAASMTEPYSHIPIYCVDIPYDARDSRTHGHNFVISESYILNGLELGWQKVEVVPNGNLLLVKDQWSYDTSAKIYEVQKRRYENTGIVTARSEHQLDKAPYFVYDTIYSDGFPWNTLTQEGVYSPASSAVASKAALGLWSLYDNPYSKILFDYTSELYDPEKGFYEGFYENGMGPIKIFTANNNGIILEALLYRKIGPLLQGPLIPTRWEIMTSDDPHTFSYDGIKKCYPMSECPGSPKGPACGCKRN